MATVISVEILREVFIVCGLILKASQKSVLPLQATKLKQFQQLKEIEFTQANYKEFLTVMLK